MNQIKYHQILNQATQYQSQGNITQAIKLYEFLIEKGFNKSLVFANYGIILINSGRLKDAILSINKAIALNPKDATLHSNLGGILRELGKLEEAELSTRKAIELKPDFANAHSNLGSILRGLGRLKEAELSTRKAIELKPDFVNAHLNLGSILRDLGKLEEAEFSTRKAVKLKPDFVNALLNLGSILRDLGKLEEAELSTSKAIKLNPDFATAHSNLGGILKNIGNLKEAELSVRKAIELNPDFAEAHSNLGNILADLGKLKDAEISTRKAIELDPNCAVAYFSLSTLKYTNENNLWINKLFSKNFLNNKNIQDQINIFFARANIFHNDKKYQESSKCLKLANKLKLNIKKSQSEIRINKSKKLLIETNEREKNQKKSTNCPQSIFILGMPRSGSTLIESIISMNNEVYDLGEINILEESFIDQKQINQKLTLTDIYWEKISKYTRKFNITTNKCLINYQYAGIISKEIINAKIIHCFRNPLDNILSIFRANFANGNEYSSSLVDTAKVYIDQEEIMTVYKKRFRSKIYDLNYDLLVQNPYKEIKSLISWLGWDWHDQYLSPHLNPRSVSTASNIQVRSPINSKSIGGWKNYKDMLKPAMEIITQNSKYQDLKY